MSPTAQLTLHAQSFHVPLRLRTNSPALFAQLPACLPHSSTLLPDTPPNTETFTLLADPQTIRLFQNHTLTHTFADPATLLQHLTTDLMVHVANFAPHRVFLHAGVVALHGRAIVLPGPSFAGKTTLVHALVSAGATYYSDEYALIDAEGLIHPYTRDLQLRRPGHPQQHPTPPPGLIGTQPIRAAQVIFAHFDPTATWHPTPVTPGMATLEMLRHTIPIQRTPTRVLQTLIAMLAGAHSFRTPRGDAASAAQAILSGGINPA